MTEKRFTLEEFGLNFIVNDNGRNLTAKKTVDLLNQLSEENEQLKDALNQRTDQCDKYYKKNEQLKSDLKSYQNMVKQYINLHIDKIRRRYVNPTKEEVAERTRIIRDLEQLQKELQE